MEIKSETALIEYGKRLADGLKPPAVIELVGDVGAGKTTLTRGIAKGLGIKEPVTSPSFTISKRYKFDDGVLVHYDFYRLADPGIMRAEIAETLRDPHAIVVIEWGESIADLLPKNHIKIEINLKDDGVRLLEAK
ncbi:tRNA (adenosine(37)-N6)-threonylcarbamoyltransferase complex ATPase subunit type 1 TsaE [Candidatus Saccharibacteria bacterium]|nr:tRNA (adenosine(37)-N6)-threonylcarbamoyltransferase complex ATPase subunit type 1 TsaE [Candidatus Saccharibacteria bacterium]